MSYDGLMEVDMKRVLALTAVSALMLGGCSFSLGGSDDPSA